MKNRELVLSQIVVIFITLGVFFFALIVLDKHELPAASWKFVIAVSAAFIVAIIFHIVAYLANEQDTSTFSMVSILAAYNYLVADIIAITFALIKDTLRTTNDVFSAIGAVLIAIIAIVLVAITFAGITHSSGKSPDELFDKNSSDSVFFFLFLQVIIISGTLLVVLFI
jgi:hypothetical protein